MAAQMDFLVALVLLLCSCPSATGVQRCSAFRHLENGQTYFRYGGLLVIFCCHPGYKLHGYKSNSCVSGHWAREIPVCVGSGCNSPGPLTHGTSSVNEDGSWAVFSCKSGFHLHGPSMLYCKGRTWNSTKPVCRESDMMSSVSGGQMPNTLQSLQAATPPGSQQQSHYGTLPPAASKEANLKFGLQSFTPSHFSAVTVTRVNNPEPYAVKSSFLQQHIHYPIFKDDVQATHFEIQETNKPKAPETGNRSDSTEKKAPQEETETMNKVMKVSAVKLHLSTATSTLSLVSGTSAASFPADHSAASTAVEPTLPAVVFAPTSPSSHTTSALLRPDYQTVLKQEEPHTSQDSATPPEEVTNSTESESEDQKKDKTGKTLKTQQLNVTFPSIKSSNWTENHNLPLNTTSKPLLLSLGPSTRPVCLHPPVPAHGTFYFHNVENPGPGEYRHYIQYACYSGYTLAHGDVHSYCQQGGTWSGVMPACLDVDECLLPAAVTNCMFGCVNTIGSFHCQCPAGYSFQSEDSRCQDIDECVGNDGLGLCMEQCHNTPGSYRCSCTYGRILAGDGHGCIAECPPGYRKQPTTTPDNSTTQTPGDECVDIDECQEEKCEWQCVNLPGSHRCICPRGYALQNDGRRCKDINECSRKNGGCSHLCVNQRGGHKCACPPSHRLSPYSWKKCVPRNTATTAG
ncbi:uncharacterized protein V6R79_005425 [Siganus canaliculatus]